jgi:branched-chain amino acid transport system ATP-binding protein
MAPLLQTTELAVSFGGVRALDGVDLVVEPARLVGLIGPNGAGKSTFIDAVTGFVASTGRVEFAGRDLSGAPA